jgi:hypothetical protein
MKKSNAADMLAAAFTTPELNGTAIANQAVIEANARGSVIIFLPRSVYQDLCYRANLPELARYKGKTIWITSDPVE